MCAIAVALRLREGCSHSKATANTSYCFAGLMQRWGIFIRYFVQADVSVSGFVSETSSNIVSVLSSYTHMYPSINVNNFQRDLCVVSAFTETLISVRTPQTGFISISRVIISIGWTEPKTVIFQSENKITAREDAGTATCGWIYVGKQTSILFSNFHWLFLRYFDPVNIITHDGNWYFSGWPYRYFS